MFVAGAAACGGPVRVRSSVCRVTLKHCRLTALQHLLNYSKCRSVIVLWKVMDKFDEKSNNDGVNKPLWSWRARLPNVCRNWRVWAIECYDNPEFDSGNILCRLHGSLPGPWRCCADNGYRSGFLQWDRDAVPIKCHCPCQQSEQSTPWTEHGATTVHWCSSTRIVVPEFAEIDVTLVQLEWL